MYKAELYFRVFTHDGHATFYKELALPFLPFPGLNVYTSARDLEGGKVAEVAWSAPQERFLCRLQDDDWSRDKRGSLEDATRFWQEMGWQKKGPT